MARALYQTPQVERGTTISAPETSALCQACGLCCTGHFFLWVRLNARELDGCQSIGLNVIRNDPRQRGFTQPCPAWKQTCTVYASPYYPRGCRSYQCKLFKEVAEDAIPLGTALRRVQEAREKIKAVEERLPASRGQNFRQRMVTYLESGAAGAGFQKQAADLLDLYQTVFGVKDLLEEE